MNTLEEYINQAFSMIKHIKGNRPLDSKETVLFLRNFETVLNELSKLNEEHITLSLKYRSKGFQVDEKIDEMNKLILKTKSIFKDEAKQFDWEKFGITAPGDGS